MIKMLNSQYNYKTAFSLVELSVVLIIIAMIIANVIYASEGAIKNQKIQATEEKLEIIEEAINTYVAINEKLPCPASFYDQESDANYGVSLGIDNNCSDADIFINGNIAHGTLPVTTLGLDANFMLDGFDNKFSYKISTPTTQESGFLNTDMDLSANYINSQIQYSSAVNFNNAIYAVISHGPNGYGAFPKGSGLISDRNPISSALTEEQTNTVSDTPAISTDLVVESNSELFDDIILEKNRTTILLEIGGI